MTKLFQYFAITGVIVTALAPSVALASDGLAAPPVPTNLQVPSGNKLYLKGQAEGTQNYICLPAGYGYAWTLFSPQATLYITFKWFGGDASQQIITHFLSPNPSEGGTPRATWQGSVDTSAVWGRLIPGKSSTDPNFVAAGAIPWLLLERVGSQQGPTGGDILTNTTFIHRLNTAGGVAPSSGCTQAGNVGATALVPYHADYFFYKSSAQK